MSQGAHKENLMDSKCNEEESIQKSQNTQDIGVTDGISKYIVVPPESNTESVSLRKILSKLFNQSTQCIQAFPSQGYANKKQLMNEAPRDILRILDSLNLNEKLLENINHYYQYQFPLDKLQDNLQKITLSSTQFIEDYEKSILFPYLYGVPRSMPIKIADLSGCKVNLEFVNFIAGRRSYPLSVEEYCEFGTNKRLNVSKKHYQFLLKRKLLKLNIPRNAHKVKCRGVCLFVEFSDYELIFDSRPRTFSSVDQQDLIITFLQARLLYSDAAVAQDRINYHMNLCLDMQLNESTEDQIVAYTEQLFVRSRLFFHLIERLYNFLSTQPPGSFEDIKFQPRQMSLKFYFSSSYELMKEVMGDTGQFQVCIHIQKLTFTQFLQHRLKKQTLPNTNDINQLVCLEINSSRYATLRTHNLELPKCFSQFQSQSSDIFAEPQMLLSLLENTVYSLSASKTTGYSNGNYCHSSAMFKTLIEDTSMRLVPQSNADFVLYPKTNLIFEQFNRLQPSFRNFQMDKLKKQHKVHANRLIGQEEDDTEMGGNDDDNKAINIEKNNLDDNDESCSNSEDDNDSEDSDDDEDSLTDPGSNHMSPQIFPFQIYQIESISQVRVFKQQQKLEIFDEAGEYETTIKPFSRNDISCQSLQLLLVKMIKQSVNRVLIKLGFIITGSIDWEYYIAFSHELRNTEIDRICTVKTNIDIAKPGRISLLFVVVLEEEQQVQGEGSKKKGKNNKVKISSECLEICDLMKRFSFEEDEREELKENMGNQKNNCDEVGNSNEGFRLDGFLKEQIQSARKFEIPNQKSLQTSEEPSCIRLEKLNKLLENFAVYCKELVSNDSYLYCDALTRTFDKLSIMSI